MKDPGIRASKLARPLRAWLLSALFLGLVGVGNHIAAQTQDGDHRQYTTFGAPSKLQGNPLNLSEALQPANLNKPIRAEAKVTEVCQNKGCWMILTDDERFVRVTFKDYGFFVPKDLAGKTVIVEGIISEKILPQAQARHWAQDAGKSQAEVEKIVGDRKEWTMVAETVLVP